MSHKDTYIRDGKKISEYNKKYYQAHKEKMLERARQRLIDDPNINKLYYALHKNQARERNKKYYEEHRKKRKEAENERTKGN